MCVEKSEREFFARDRQDAAFAKVDENWPESLLEVVSNVPDCEDHQSLHQPSSSSPFLHSDPLSAPGPSAALTPKHTAFTQVTFIIKSWGNLLSL